MTVDANDSIISQLVDRFTDVMIAACQTNVSKSDPSYATMVKSGRFQDDPLKVGNIVVVQNGDLDDPDYMDGITDLKHMRHNAGFDVEPREIGGTEMWYRRGTVRISCFFITKGYNEHKSRQVATTLMGRAERALANAYVCDLRDPFDEHAIKVFVYGNTFAQSGGPPASYIWRGKILWQVLTERKWT